MFSYHEETPEQVQRVINTAYHSGARLRLFYGDTKTGRAWQVEYDVTGRIGRSTGVKKVPLLIKTSRSMGGGAILDHCIVAIKSGKQWLYKHENFTAGKWRVNSPDNPIDGLPFEVMHNEVLHARFKTLRQANNYVAFMTGERMSK